MVTPFFELKMHLKYSSSQENTIELIILVRKQKKLEISHHNLGILKEISKILKTKIKLMDFYEHFEYVDKLWNEDSVDVKFETYV